MRWTTRGLVWTWHKEELRFRLVMCQQNFEETMTTDTYNPPQHRHSDDLSLFSLSVVLQLSPCCYTCKCCVHGIQESTAAARRPSGNQNYVALPADEREKCLQQQLEIQFDVASW